MRICAGQTGQPYAGLKVYAFDGSTYTGYNGTSDEDGQVTFTLPQGSYRFRADYDGVQFWSGTANHCDIPGCSSATVTLPGSLVETNVTIDYAYDGLYRLIQAYYARTGNPGDYQSGYDYEYDRVGNRIYEDAWSEYSETERSYTYDDANRLTGVDETATTYEDLSWEHILSQVENSHSYTWDANGSLLFDGESYYQYDHASRLVSVDGAEVDAGFAYNGLGDRLQQTVDGAPMTYTLDLNTGLTQVLADGTYTYLYGLDRLAQLDTGSLDTWYFLGDALGSVRQLTDAQATVTLARSYAPYGEVTDSAGSGASAYGYTGEYTDPTGMVYLRARYYAPWQGRFVSRDTWGGDANTPMSYNMWLYGYANPVLYTDPTGRYSVEQLYGLLFTGAGNSDFQTTVRTAVRLVGHAFSRATATSRNGYYSAMVSWSIFKKVYGIRQDRLMEFEWHPQTNSNPPVGREEELGCYNCRPAACITANLWVDVPLENQAACDCETTKTCYCLPKGGYTHNERYIEFASLWPNYQGADQNLRRVNNVIHELGHAFNARIGRAAQVAVRDKSVYVEGQLWQLNSRPRGFYGNGSNTWQQNTTPYPDDPNTRSSEVFADMFVGWVYNRWAEDAYGIARADFMIAHMHDWIKQAMNKP